MAAESFFTKVASDVLEATEKIANDFDALFSSVPASTEQDSATQQQQQQRQVMDDNNGDDFDEDDELLAHSPLQGIADHVLGDIMQGQHGPQGPIEHFHAFRHAITWSEPFVMALVAFQVVMFVVCIWASRRNRGLAPRIGVMVFIAVLVRSAERLNRLAARHWTSLATQNYFDAKGIFLSVMLCAPLLLDCLLMLFVYLREASQLLVQVKTAQIKKQRKETAAQESKRQRQTKKDD